MCPVAFLNTAVVLKAGDTFLALRFVEHALGQDLAYLLNAIVDSELRYDLKRHAVFLSVDVVALAGQLPASFGITAEFPVVDIVWPPMFGVGVTLVLEHLHVVPQAFAAVLVVVDDVKLFTDLTHEPNGRGVADADVPEGHHRQVAVVRYHADTLLGV